MKKSLTASQVWQFYPTVYKCGYCSLVPLQNSFPVVGYASGVYGWNYDVYEISGSVAVCTGYRSMIGQELPAAAKRIIKNASAYMQKKDTCYEQRKNYLRRAARKFAAVLSGGAK